LDGIGNRPELLNGRSSHLFVRLPVSSDMGVGMQRIRVLANVRRLFP
jgi:hypothetical protein